MSSTVRGGGKRRSVIADKRQERTCDFARYYNQRYYDIGRSGPNSLLISLYPTAGPLCETLL